MTLESMQAGWEDRVESAYAEAWDNHMRHEEEDAMTSTEQAKDLLYKLREAKRAFIKTGALPTARLQTHLVFPFEYTEADVVARFEAVWWSLQMAINDVSAMAKEWERDAPAKAPESFGDVLSNERNAR
ncbi:MAG: hypothetical protein WC829_02785 [Hyphomicrobium sp.]|jgi:hypothetical protein